MKWNAVSFVIRSKHRRYVLEFLQNNPNIPSKINEKIDISFSHVSRALRELKEMGLIELLVDSKTGRVYRITEEGKQVIKIIQKYDM